MKIVYFNQELGRHQNFTWSSNNDSLFELSLIKILRKVYEGYYRRKQGFISKSFESNIVTDFDFNNWTTDSNLGDWTESGGSVMKTTNYDNQVLLTFR